MPPQTAPLRATLRAYQVGFGDCFLLTFHYAPDETDNRHILIDFGSTGQPDNSPPKLMLKVAEDIKGACGNKLHVVVATHRHRDHISGFDSATSGPGAVIRSCQPDVVIQPWTEKPDAAIDWTGPELESALRFTGNLRNMHEVAASVVSEAKHLADPQKFRHTLKAERAAELEFIGEDNLSNKDAVKNLATMGRTNHYVYADYKLDLRDLLPGVKIHVLGPPTLKQSAEIQKQASRHDEFWMLQDKTTTNFWGMQAANKPLSTGKESVFPQADTYQQSEPPPHVRWFVRRLRDARGEQLLGLVRSLDKAMNNTSVIILFEAGGKKLLFPGDAQIENWSFALSQPKYQKLLAGTDLYKVGHHGSRNATPKHLLWEKFTKKGSKAKANRLTTVISTMEGKHGKKEETAVPRATLVTELKENSNYFSTEKLSPGQLAEIIPIALKPAKA